MFLMISNITKGVVQIMKEEEKNNPNQISSPKLLNEYKYRKGKNNTRMLLIASRLLFSKKRDRRRK